MLISAVNPVAGSVVPVTRADGSDPKATKVEMLRRKSLATLQMKETQKPLLEGNSKSKSRREMMHLTALTLGLLSLVSPLEAAASPRNVTMRQKIAKKLEELREKAGLSKPKDEEVKEDKKPMSKDKSNLSEEGKMKAKDDEKDKNNQSNFEPLSKLPLQEHPLIPSLPNILNDKTLETSLLP